MSRYNAFNKLKIHEMCIILYITISKPWSQGRSQKNILFLKGGLNPKILSLATALHGAMKYIFD